MFALCIINCSHVNLSPPGMSITLLASRECLSAGREGSLPFCPPGSLPWGAGGGLAQWHHVHSLPAHLCPSHTTRTEPLHPLEDALPQLGGHARLAQRSCELPSLQRDRCHHSFRGRPACSRPSWWPLRSAEWVQARTAHLPSQPESQWQPLLLLPGAGSARRHSLQGGTSCLAAC